ncbi:MULTISPECIES: sensor histidine kinase [Paraburkholderia]|uniref:sensor histidine kinase n=1 Tax=Paraburkholderia TaxID=1822464 RepID=UPI00224E8AA0|nr:MULTISPECIES: histidine kinase [Paraburkholderia]MCX4160123.1 histidine kinase [Paraburkholderia megapolitana]MDN7155622.1 histidine kinase [Paraburkholderia sp. CHISQ3]MDQ6492666.1 histidine kinase [Paraburkholderia megapolitana]
MTSRSNSKPPGISVDLPIPGRQLLARYARESLPVAGGNALIAAGLTAVGGGLGFGENLVFSEAIGLSIMLLIQLGRFLLQRRYALTAPRLAVLMIAAVVGGTAIGLALASGLLGLEISKTFATTGLAATGWIALVATLLATWYGWSRARIAGLSEQVVRTALLKEIADKNALSARLQALQAQIEPHFLFNTLATLDSLIASDPPKARELLGSLNRLLRATLEASRAERETLADQFAVLESMLGVQAIRLGSRLSYALHLPADCANLQVPPMLLQPLVENALKHGIQVAVAGGRIEVRAMRSEQQVELTVSDTGRGFGATPATQGSGVGLANVRDRLAALHGERASLVLSENLPHGVVARVLLPVDDDPRKEEMNS